MKEKKLSGELFFSFSFVLDLAGGSDVDDDMPCCFLLEILNGLSYMCLSLTGAVYP